MEHGAGAWNRTRLAKASVLQTECGPSRFTCALPHGFEPRFQGSEPCVLPLDERSKWCAGKAAKPSPRMVWNAGVEPALGRWQRSVVPSDSSHIKRSRSGTNSARAGYLLDPKSGLGGFEPPLVGSQPSVLPLHYSLVPREGIEPPPRAASMPRSASELPRSAQCRI